jgi:hypothetical protein
VKEKNKGTKNSGLRLVQMYSVAGSKLRRIQQPSEWQPFDPGHSPASTAGCREEWLTRLMNALRPSFEKIGRPIPERVRVTCGWPSTAGLGHVRRRVGECWPASASADGTVEIFISPFVDDAIEVAEVLVHESIHATGVEGHRGHFPRIAKAIGLSKPWRATHATQLLRDRLNSLITEIGVGPYPHAKLNAGAFPYKKDGTRLHKLVCPEHGYTVRTTQKWIDFGLPRCPCGLQLVRSERSNSVWRSGPTGFYE